MLFRRLVWGLAALALAFPALAQERTPSHCIALAETAPGIAHVIPASLPDVPREEVFLHYIAHASFLIRSHGGLNMVTDYTGFTGTLPLIPDVVTMNHAHDSHWTPFPDPAIPHALQGWGDFGEGIDHEVDLGEVLIRNVSTDIRSQFADVEPEGNSIFVFEMAGLCIGHLGHLHHEPTEAQYAALGRVDVLMAPVDGGYTLPLPVMMQVIRRLKSSIVIPMHWFSGYALDAFLTGMSDEFQVVELEGSSVSVSIDRLPSEPTIMVLRPSYLNVAR
ncbi:Zn-dependent hydrolase [Sulfitobacter alexandrii]|uniref:Zn-dependent hydrolase n=1 Tax=Sulfitobacter alexandrii TaxID=1917485 RepID=A0A1J0WIN3_9RHOB|nr:MBL fold metallo-hydrolase [Sulfitobacter alexandrii]APE44178.1 Zn-dependent hydrolase [Sulfitobacter alexandrii]